MTDFLKMDVFFGVATVAAVAVTLITIVALAYAVRLLRTLNRIGDDIEEETEAIREDVEAARRKVRGFRFASLFLPLFKKSTRRKKRK
ncbi:MAG TPA: hypothetical protein VJA87_02640 [Candidatus Paceibacterota bacterium]